MMKKAALCILAFAVAFAAACGGTADPEAQIPEDPSQTPPEEQYEPERIEPNGEDIADYRIVYAADAPSSSRHAAEELRDYIKKATGVTLRVVTDGEAAQADEIVIGNTNRDPAGMFDFDELGNEGFRIKTDGKKLYIASNDPAGAHDCRGALYGVYTFLEKLGYRFYTKDVEKIPSDEDVFVPLSADDKQIPRFAFRDVTFGAGMWAGSEEWCVKQKLNGYFTRNFTEELGGCLEFASGGSDSWGLVHSMIHLVPFTDQNKAEHPEWFALQPDGSRLGGERGQVCYTNEGMYQRMMQTVNLWLVQEPDCEYISISHNDNNNFCTCPSCQESYAEYGISGTILNVVNRAAREIKESGSDVKVIFLAYGDARALPKGGVVPEENVSVQCASSYCQTHGVEGEGCRTRSYLDTFTEDLCAGTRDVLEQWGAISNELILYNYVQNYYRHPAPFPNYEATRKSLRYFAEKTKAQGLFSEGLGANSLEFGELKDYVYAKLHWNPYMTEAEMQAHIQDFLEGYYGGAAAATYIKKYIDKTVELVGDHHLSTNEDCLWTFDFGQNDFGTPDGLTAEYYEGAKAFAAEAESWWQAAEMYASPDALERVKRSHCQHTFWTLYVTMDYDLLSASDSEKAALYDKNKKLYRAMQSYDALNIFGNGNINPTYETVCNFEYSPRRFILEKMEHLIPTDWKLEP